MILSVRHLNIYRSGAPLLRDVNFDLQRDETMVVRSKVGDGGTLLLRCLTGITDAKSGEVLYGGVDIQKLARENRGMDMRARVGFVYERHGLISIQDVFRNISMPLRYHTQLSISEIKQRVYNVADELHISDLLSKEPNELTEVQTWLVNLARALVIRPRLLLIDKFGSRTSVGRQWQLLGILRRHQAKEHFGAILLTHNSNADYGDSTYTIRNGEMRREDD